ncbi:MAG: His/Gly/Thr/Pro-type tRNA ligase C-terminal domain-containing protein [Patescibacteria group bacterium]|nr:His/Gly/Thr/Pro-type tRNA ligase C-terminal domain-containing protein [Patescibacteria group bacterium]MDD5490448.1 His/Gly/Thr/Pro-type tRNA ligase C-terminal domain-containing protein [Patescibacteria group bacterium]
MRQSQLFTKTIKNIPAEEKSVNAQFLIKGGFIDKVMSGVYTFLPLGWRVINKIENIVREEINFIGGQEVSMPALQPKENWELTNRWDNFDALIKVEIGEDSKFSLGPTHEEIVTPLVKKFASSYKDLPVYVYQIQTKFRNEARPKSGLLRGREFIMKDLYSFHTSEEDLDKYYTRAEAAYEKIYKRLNLGGITYKTFASGGAFSKYSHEYQTVSPNGEDTIYICDKCRIAVNKELIESEEGGGSKCPECGNKDLKEEKAIEVGNIFKLKTKFTECFNYKYADEDGKLKPVIMGCYGIGISRLMGALVEVFHDDKGIIWPEAVAPFRAHLLILGDDKAVAKKAEVLYNKLLDNGIEVLFDDREESAGVKFADADLIGIPYRLVISPKTLDKGSVELKKRDQERMELVKISEILKLIK